jgi:hypothetical protein
MRGKRKHRMILSLCAVSLVSACAAPGDFCEVVSGPIQFPEQVAAVVVQGARPEAVKIDTQNRYGAARCGWKG